MSAASELVWRQLHWPSPLPADLSLNLLRRLSSDLARHPTLFETRSAEGNISHLVGTAASHIRDLEATIVSLIPDMAMSKGQPSGATTSVRLVLGGKSLSLLDRAPQTSRALLAALSSARFRGESAVLQLTIGRGIAPRTHGRSGADPTQSLLSVLVMGPRPRSSEVERRVRAKTEEGGFRVVLRVSVTANSPGRRREILTGILAAIRTAQASGTSLDFERDSSPFTSVPTRRWIPLTAVEGLALSAWPLDAQNLPGMPPAHPKLLPPPRKLKESVRSFAVSNAPGKPQRIGISVEDSLFHTVAIGPTGSGKSTALLNLITADLDAGLSVVVLDFKRDLHEDILERIPPSRIDQVVVLDPTQTDPAGMNPLVVPGTSPELIADGIVGIFRDLFPSAFGPATSDIVHASLLTLAHDPKATLTQLPRLLTDPRFRRSMTARLQNDDDLLGFWDHFDGVSDKQQAQFIGPVLSRLRQFLLRPSLKRVLDQPEPRFSLGELFTSPRILLVPMSSGQLGNEASRLLGSLLVSNLWHLTLARAGVPQASRKPVSIYIDEAQEFLRLGDLSDALARSRSLGVAWHLAHQFRAQMPKDMRSAIDANARNKIVYGLDIEDAKAMAAMAPKLVPEDFMTLPKHAVYARLMQGGEQLDWISADTLGPPPRTSDAAEVVARSQERFGRPPTPSDCPPTRETDAPKREEPSAPVGRKRRAP